MFTHPDRIGQLAREHHRHLLAEASQRKLRHHHGRPGRTRDAATRISRRLIEAIARAGVVTAETADATWPASPHQLGASAADARPAGHGH